MHYGIFVTLHHLFSSSETNTDGFTLNACVAYHTAEGAYSGSTCATGIRNNTVAALFISDAQPSKNAIFEAGNLHKLNICVHYIQYIRT